MGEPWLCHSAHPVSASALFIQLFKTLYTTSCSCARPFPFPVPSPSLFFIHKWCAWLSIEWVNAGSLHQVLPGGIVVFTTTEAFLFQNTGRRRDYSYCTDYCTYSSLLILLSQSSLILLSSRRNPHPHSSSWTLPPLPWHRNLLQLWHPSPSMSPCWVLQPFPSSLSYSLLVFWCPGNPAIVPHNSPAFTLRTMWHLLPRPVLAQRL